MALVLKGAAEKDTAVPNGTYRATLTKVFQFKNNYGDRIGFEFTLQSKGVKGKKVMRSTSPILARDGKLWEMVTGILGRDLTDDEMAKGIDLEHLAGVECAVQVLQSRKNGRIYSDVQRVMQLTEDIFA